MIHPTEKDIGRTVIYRGKSYGGEAVGIITSFTHDYVYVRFGEGKKSTAWAGSIGCERVNLFWRDYPKGAEAA